MAQNITLQGASYSDVPSVVLPKTGGGTASFTDVTPTTATASDVGSGKYFFNASGVLTLGTGSGGIPSVTQDQDGYLVLDDDQGQNVTVEALSVSASGTYTAPTGKAYSPVTVPAGSVSASATKGTVTNHSVSVTPKATVGTAGFLAAGDTNGTAVTVSASELVSGTKSITANGTGIDVSTYASVDVSVSGGASNIVFGEFTAGTAGTVQEVSVSYSGNGYPIFISVYPSDGYHSGATLYDTDHQYAMVEMSAFRSDPTTSSVIAAYGTYLYKSQATGMMISGTRINGQNMFGTQSDPVSGMGCVAIRGKNGFAVLVSDASYGFLSGIAYKYVIVYSS